MCLLKKHAFFNLPALKNCTILTQRSAPSSKIVSQVKSFALADRFCRLLAEKLRRFVLSAISRMN